MNKEQIKGLLYQFGMPALLTVLGVILLMNPDSATALVSSIIGWVLVIIGAVKAISMAERRSSTPAGWILAAACVIPGVFILKNPLILAEAVGRLLGLLVAIRGALDLAAALKRKNAGLPWRGALIMAGITLAVGVILAVLPLTLTRTILRLCGVVVAVIGVFNILEKLQEMKLLYEGSEPNIIDADE